MNILKNKFFQIFLIFSILFGCFYSNPFKVYGNDKTFEQTYAKTKEGFSSDSESYVVGSLIEAQKYQFTAGLGRLARLHVEDNNDNWFYNVQYTFKVFNEDLEYQSDDFEHYFSQLGGQGLLFRIMDQGLSGFDGATRLTIMRNFNIGMLSLMLAIIGYFIFSKFKLGALVFFVLALLFNHWIPLSVTNLYWVMWTMFLPMAISCAYCMKNEHTKIETGITMFLLFLSILFRASCGYEFISTILVAMMIPFMYNETVYFKSFKQTLKNLLLPTISGLLGFFACVGLHIGRYMLEGWNFNDSIMFLYKIIVKRTYGTLEQFGMFNESLEANLKEPLFDVINKYFNASILNIQIGTSYLEIKVWMLCVIILVATIILLILIKNKKCDIKKSMALIIMTTISILAPISWFVLAKGHAAAHLHLDPILWYIPFIPIGFALVGYTISQVVYLRKKL